MGRLVHLLAMLTSVAAISGHAAQAEDEHRVIIDDHTLDEIMTVTTMSLMATTNCGIGDRMPWMRVVMAIDRRYWNCVEQNPLWKIWVEGNKELQEFRKKNDGGDVGIGVLAFRQELKKRTEIANAVGRSAYCALSPWDLVLDPDAVIDEQKATYKRENPDVKIDKLLDLFSRVRALGGDERWVEAPCEGAFWPLSYFSSK